MADHVDVAEIRARPALSMSPFSRRQELGRLHAQIEIYFKDYSDRSWSQYRKWQSSLKGRVVRQRSLDSSHSCNSRSILTFKCVSTPN